MPEMPPVQSRDFYDFFPLPNHRTGDIWRCLPTFGMLDCVSTTGVVITPACDLANEKCETITYLPIVSVAQYLISSAFRYECWQEIVGVLAKTKGYSLMASPGRFDLPRKDDLEAVLEMQKDADAKQLSAQETARINSYVNYIEKCNEKTVSIMDVRNFMKSDRYKNYISRIVTNAHKPDIHFLPADEQVEDLSAMPVHSLVLFRYPLTIPVAVLDAAHHTPSTQWNEVRGNLRGDQPILNHMPQWPIKLMSLKGEFLSDMITRYVNMYIRLGSSDFSEGAVQRFTEEIVQK